MSRKDDILEEMDYATAHIPETVKKQKEAGKKVIGVMPVYAPEELVHAAGMFPVGCWGGCTSISKAVKYLPPFACSVVQSITEFAMKGTYDGLDGMLMSGPCDTLKCMTQNWPTACPQVPSAVLIYPNNHKLDCGVVYLEKELQKIKGFLEKTAKVKITEEALNRSIGIYNENRKAMQAFTEITAARPGCISAKMRHAVMKSRYCMWKEDHTKLVLALNEELKKYPEHQWDGQKIVLAGVMAEPDSLLELFDEFHMAVVGDELAQESRQFRSLVPDGENGLRRLALQWRNMEGCTFVYDPDKKRAKMLADMARKTQADGVVLCLMKFCDPEEFDVPWLKQALDEIHVPMLSLDIDLNADSSEQAKTRIQAFGEQLRSAAAAF